MVANTAANVVSGSTNKKCRNCLPFDVDDFEPGGAKSVRLSKHVQGGVMKLFDYCILKVPFILRGVDGFRLQSTMSTVPVSF